MSLNNSIGSEEEIARQATMVDSIAEMRARPVDKSDPLNTAARGPIARADAIDEVADVLMAALWAVKAAMVEGAEHGYVRNWQNQSVGEHLVHVQEHVRRAVEVNFRASVAGEFERWAEFDQHVTHALCRLAMALIQAEAERENNA